MRGGRRPPRDVGLQAERTTLAWNRTALAVLVNAFLVLRAGTQAGQPLTFAAGVLLAVLAAGVAAAGRWRSGRLLREADVHVADRLVTGAFAAACLCALIALGAVVAT